MRKKYTVFIGQKVKELRFLKHLWILHTPKKFIQSHLLMAGPGSGTAPSRLDLDSDSATLLWTRDEGPRLESRDWNTARGAHGDSSIFLQI
jgi:hypothetical protein